MANSLSIDYHQGCCRAGEAVENGTLLRGLQKRAFEILRVFMTKHLTAIIRREGNGFVSLCPELDIASQGDTIETARDNLREALELFFEAASSAEIQDRLGEETFVTQVEITSG